MKSNNNKTMLRILTVMVVSLAVVLTTTLVSCNFGVQTLRRTLESDFGNSDDQQKSSDTADSIDENTDSTSTPTEYEVRVLNNGSEYDIAGITIPSILAVMNDNDIHHIFSDESRIAGTMIVPHILNYSSESEPAFVEIVEVIYTDVDDVWTAIDIYFGQVLHVDYEFTVNQPPSEWLFDITLDLEELEQDPYWNTDYRFCELLKDAGDDGIIYVAAIYSRDEGIIKVQFGIIENSRFPTSVIGPLDFEQLSSRR